MKALVGAFSVIVKTGCGTDGSICGTNFKLWAECWAHCLPSPRDNCPHYIPTTASEWSLPLDMDIVWLYSAITAAPQQESGNRNTAVEFISRCQLSQGVPMPINDIYSQVLLYFAIMAYLLHFPITKIWAKWQNLREKGQDKKFQKNTRSDMKIQKYSSIQVFKYSSIHVFKYSSIQVFKYSSIQVFKYLSIQVFKY